MIDTKKRAKYILEDYANCYSQVDLEELEKYLDKIKAEAYKEFADRLKAKAMAKYKTIDNEYLYEFDNNFIDNLLKELVGEK